MIAGTGQFKVRGLAPTTVEGSTDLDHRNMAADRE
jgi:hypothetical protein